MRWFEHPRGRVWAALHRKFGPVVYDPADQAGVPANCVRLFVAFQARSAVCLRDFTRPHLATTADPDVLQTAVDAHFRSKALARLDPPQRPTPRLRLARPSLRSRTDAGVRVGGRVCERCGSAIPSDRLDAVPEATRCVLCQTAADRAPADASLSGEFCPRCAAGGFRSQLVWRRPRDAGQAGEFLGCSRYPHCHYKARR